MLQLAVALIIALSLAFSLVTQRCEAQASKDPINLTVQGSHGANLLRFTPDGRHMVTAPYGSQLYLWQVETGRLLRTIQALAPGETVQDLQALPDGETAVVGTRDVLRIVNLRTGEQKSWFSVGDRFGSKDWMLSPDGKRLLTQGDILSHPRAWNLETGRLLFTLHRPDEPPEFKFRYAYVGGLNSTALSPDGKWIISSAFGKPIALFNAETGQFVRDMKGTAGKWAVDALQFTQDGRHFLMTTEIGNVQTLQVWDFGKQELMRSARNPFTTYEKHRLLNDATSVLTVAKKNDRYVLVHWDLASGKTLREFDAVSAFAVNRREDAAALAEGDRVYAVRLSDGQPVAPVSAHGQSAWLPAQLSPSRLLLSREEKSGLAQVLDLVGGFVTVAQGHCRPGPYTDHAAIATVDCTDGTTRFLSLVDVRDGNEVARLPYPFADGLGIARLRYGDHYASVFGGDPDLNNSAVMTWDTLRPGAPTRRALAITDKTQKYISPDGDFSTDGQLFASAEGSSGLFSVWSTATGGKLFTLVDPAGGKSDKGTARTHLRGTEGARFTNNPAMLLTFGDDTPKPPSFRDDLVMRSLQKDRYTIKTWDVASRRLLRTVDMGEYRVQEVLNRTQSPNVFALCDSGIVSEIDLNAGRIVRSSRPIAAGAHGMRLTRDEKLLLVVARDSIFVVNTETFDVLARVMTSADGDWLVITPPGFFAASPKGAELLNVARGYDLYRVQQMFQSLFDPDLVRENLALDPDDEVRKAAAAVDIRSILDSGDPPKIALVSPEPQSIAATEVLAVTTRITDQGGGIGRLEWRVNGVTAAVMAVSDRSGKEQEITQTLALESGENAIEVVAYNGRNLLASLPLALTVRWVAPANQPRPKLFLMAIGINAYAGALFQPLSLAVADAKAFAATLKAAGQGLYADVDVTMALDGEAAAENLEKTIRDLGSRIHPRDTFVLFAAAHGTSVDGRFYMIPQDYRGGIELDELARGAVDQNRLQDWVTNRIKARKAIILLDTCESGALVSGHLKSHSGMQASEAAIGRLHEATGRPVLTAAAEGRPAFEGYEGHGVFTWALLDALKNGDRNSNGIIELSELVAHVQEQVPKISTKLNGRGRASVAARGSAEERQSARFGSRGEDFALVVRLK